jgi:hypothetical protein
MTGQDHCQGCMSSNACGVHDVPYLVKRTVLLSASPEPLNSTHFFILTGTPLPRYYSPCLTAACATIVISPHTTAAEQIKEAWICAFDAAKAVAATHAAGCRAILTAGLGH